jgi:hypothetical protein
MMRIYISFLVFLLTIPGFSQNKKAKVVTVTGVAQVKMEPNMTLQETFDKAEQLAKIDAIQKAFGTYVEQQTDMTIENGKTDFNIIGSTKVKGEWLETLKKNFEQDLRTEKTSKGILQQVPWVTCFIKGKVREVIPKAQLEFHLLNIPNAAARTNDFYDGEQLYLWFKSPVNGYLSVFLEDNDAVYRLLPSEGMEERFQSGVPVKGDTEYIFFSPENNAFKPINVDEFILNVNKPPMEYNYIYIVFSEKPFCKPMLHKSRVDKGKIIPRSLTKKEFAEWLSYNRSLDPAFQDKKIKISIHSRN